MKYNNRQRAKCINQSSKLLGSPPLYKNAPNVLKNNSRGTSKSNKKTGDHIQEEFNEREEAEQDFVKRFGKVIVREKCHSKKTSQ